MGIPGRIILGRSISLREVALQTSLYHRGGQKKVERQGSAPPPGTTPIRTETAALYPAFRCASPALQTRLSNPSIAASRSAMTQFNRSSSRLSCERPAVPQAGRSVLPTGRPKAAASSCRTDGPPACPIRAARDGSAWHHGARRAVMVRRQRVVSSCRSSSRRSGG